MIDYPPLDTSAPTFPSEADLVHLMCRHVPYIEQYWVDENEEYGYFGSLDVNEFQPPGGPINEMIIRSLGDELRGYAALHQSAFFDPSVAGIEKARPARPVEPMSPLDLRAPSERVAKDGATRMGRPVGRRLGIVPLDRGHRNGSQPRCGRTGAGRAQSRPSRTRL